MGIFSGLFKSRDKPQNRTTGSNYAFFFGGTTSGKAVTERSAMQMTADFTERNYPLTLPEKLPQQSWNMFRIRCCISMDWDMKNRKESELILIWNVCQRVQTGDMIICRWRHGMQEHWDIRFWLI